MKKIYYLFIAVLLLSSTATSAKPYPFNIGTKSVSLNSKDQLYLQIELGDITKMSSSEIEEKINNAIKNDIPKNTDLTCTVTIKASVNVGLATFEVTATVTGPCDQISAAAANVTSQLIAQIKSQMAKK